MISNISIKIGIAVGALAVAAFSSVEEDQPKVIHKTRIPEVIDRASPPCLQMYKYIRQYADTFDIPLRYAFGIANAETSYKGPFHWRYNHAQGSSAGALGPMQIMLPTARSNNHDNVSPERLRNDIQYNVRTSMKVLRKLYDKYGDWKTVFGCYNTGRPCVNGYAHKVYNYQPDWQMNIPKH
jgi:soluble lytic murein transglycosylase-like protein